MKGVNDENLHITYEYNTNGLRTSKTENGITTNYAYNDEHYLVSQYCDGESIEFIYDEDVYGSKSYKGFYYQNTYYEYSYDENKIIDGLNKDGVKIVQYTYNDCVPADVYALDESGNYVDKTGDSAFIGNINPIRYSQRYYEEKLHWYYVNGRYYSPQSERYIDGISEDRAVQLHGVYPDFELMVKTYTFGRIQTNTAARINPDIAKKIEVVAKVIFCESSFNKDDQLAVAWVIKNRILSNNTDFAGVTNSYEVVTQPGQFLAFGSYEYINFGQNQADFNNEFYLNAVRLARAVDGDLFATNYPKPEGFDSQLNFYSIVSFMGTTVENDQIIKRRENGGRILYENCWSVPVHPITPSNHYDILLDLSIHTGVYNVFCTSTYQ